MPYAGIAIFSIYAMASQKVGSSMTPARQQHRRAGMGDSAKIWRLSIHLAGF
jgi:hypothetical protein